MTSGANKKWSDLSPTQKGACIAGGVAEIVLTAYVVRDLAKRPAEAVRGPKALWALGMILQPVGPVAYLGVGRRKGTPAA
jgi:hypothetical protein